MAMASLASSGSTSKGDVSKDKILDEDSYVEALSAIIKRDFFPHLDYYRWKLAYLEASETNDPQKLRELHAELMAARSSGTPNSISVPGGTPYDTPRSFSTTPRSSAGTPRSRSHGQSGDEKSKLKKVTKKISLDAFCRRYTSEDNAAFQELLKKDNGKLKQKYAWLLEKEQESEQKLLPAPEAPLLLTNGEEGNSEKSEDPNRLELWKYTARNTLMYFPESLPKPTGPGEEVMGPPKEVSFRNTRFHGKASQQHIFQREDDRSEVIWAPIGGGTEQELLGQRRAKMDSEKYDLDDLYRTPRAAGVPESPRVNGYGFVMTPSPAPGVDASPLMTWGRLDGTPLILDPSDSPLLPTDLSSGPSFRMPDTPSRDKALLKLADNASKNAKIRARNSSQVARSTAAGYLSSPSPSGKYPLLSPAGQRVMHRLKSGGRADADYQLRASYTSPHLSPSPTLDQQSSKRSEGRPTPIPSSERATPTASSGRKTSSRGDRARPAVKMGSASRQSDPSGSSLTDGLLNI